MSGNRTPAGFYAARSTRRGRRLASTAPARLTAPVVDSPRYSQPQTYQPNESLFERREYQQELPFSDTEELEEFDSHYSRRTSLDTPAQSSALERLADVYTPPTTEICHHNWSPSSTLASSSIVAMLQEQQGIVQKILTEQQGMRKLVEQNEKRVKILEDSLKKLSDQSSSSACSSGGEKPRTVTKNLTVSVLSVYCV